jgi:hypothetical protein
VKTQFLLLVTILAGVAYADGGAVQFSAASGPFVVTLFAQPSPLRVGPVDMSVLVQRRSTGEPILDATVVLAIRPSRVTGAPRFSKAVHAHTGNQLLQSASVDIPSAGAWSVQLFVSKGREEAIASGELSALPASGQFAAIWPFLVLPPFAISLFALHQRLSRIRARYYLR